jgi:hypothetical protein
MKKFVVAFANLNTGELVQELVEAVSDIEACISYLNFWEAGDTFPTSMEEIHDYCSNCDCWISVLELKRELTKRPGGGLQNQVAGFDSQARVH